ncbi:MAG: response regulator [Chloroflexi bacterium]|nr:response regulator [Chloroflexota bacterium]
MAISERQAYRDLRQAEGDLAALLCSYLQSADGELSTAVHSRTRVELALEEADRLAGPPQRIDVGELVAGALSAVSRLGEQRGVQLMQGDLGALGSLCTDRQLARQALVAVLSFAVQHARPATTITISGSRRGVEVRLRVDLTLHSPEAPSAVPAIADQFIQRLGGRCATRIAPDGTMSLVLALPDQAQRTVLVIDDHEGLIELFQRYLTGEQYLVLTATNGQQGMRLAIAERPDVIVLDVMMPGEDGWEILEQLSTQQTTRGIPVIVCSVLEEPELALSLGAAGYLAKPVTRMRLLQELASCCRTPPPECSPEPPPQS